MRLVNRRQVEDFRQAFDGEIDSLVGVYRKAACDILDLLSREATSLAQRRRGIALLRQYEAILADLHDESAAWLEMNLGAAYGRGLDFGDASLKNVRKAGINLGVSTPETFSLVHQQAVSAIVGEVSRTMDFAFSQIGRRADDLFRQVGIREVAKGVVEGKSRRQVSAAIKQELIDKGKLQFVDKAGRAWDLDTYAEMVARTTTRETMTQGTIDRLLEHGVELGQIDSHGASDFCIYYEGMIVSIGPERVAGYPTLEEIGGKPPWHPNCSHCLTPFVIQLSSPQEREAGIRPDWVVTETPAQLQKRFRQEFPERAKAEGQRLRQQAARRSAARERRSK